MSLNCLAVTALGLVTILVVVFVALLSTDDRADVRTREPSRDATTAQPPLTVLTPADSPNTKLALGVLTLDEPLQHAVAALGPPSSTAPDIFGTAHTWNLQSGALLTVSAWDDTEEINSLYAFVPSGSPAQIGAFGGVVVGVSALGDVVAAWGPHFTAASSPFDDFVVSYIECVGPYPVVIKFDQETAASEQFVPDPGSPLWDDPVTSLLVAYADEPPGSAGCSSLRP